MSDDYLDKSVEEELNDRIEGGGCTESWEAMTELRNSKEASRREMLRKAVAAALVGAAGTGVAGTSAASSGNQISSEEVSTSLISGKEAQKLKPSYLKTDEYKELAQEARSNGDRVRPNTENTQFYKITAGDRSRVYMALELEEKQADTGFITVGKNPKTDQVTTAGLEYTRRDEKGAPTHVEFYDAQLKESGEFTPKQTIADVRSEIGDSRDGVSTMGVGDVACNGCGGAIGIICEVGLCGIPLYAACGASALLTSFVGSIPGVACLEFVAIVCGLITIFGCGPALTDAVCDDRLNVC